MDLEKIFFAKRNIEKSLLVINLAHSVSETSHFSNSKRPEEGLVVAFTPTPPPSSGFLISIWLTELVVTSK